MIHLCCVLTEPYKLQTAEVEGLGILLRTRGVDHRPLAVWGEGTPSEKAKKCIAAGFDLATTARLVPPTRTMDDLRNQLMKEKIDGRTSL